MRKGSSGGLASVSPFAVVSGTSCSTRKRPQRGRGGGSSRGCLVWKISGVMECVGEVGGVWQLEAQTEIRFELRCAVLNILGSSMHGGGVGVGV